MTNLHDKQLCDHCCHDHGLPVEGLRYGNCFAFKQKTQSQLCTASSQRSAASFCLSEDFAKHQNCLDSM